MDREQARKPSRWKVWALICVLAFPVAWWLFRPKNFVEAFKMPAASMLPAIQVGDHVLVNKFAFGYRVLWAGYLVKFDEPKRGDVVVFDFPRDPTKTFIKRVIGIPGDRIEFDYGQLLVNGQAPESEPLGEYRYKSIDGEVVAQRFRETISDANHEVLHTDNPLGISPGLIRSFTIPDGMYFMLGDNRDRSNDSRVWGFVDSGAILGKATRIYFSKELSRIGTSIH
jgi:signal peptidase I